MHVPVAERFDEPGKPDNDVPRTTADRSLLEQPGASPPLAKERNKAMWERLTRAAEVFQEPAKKARRK